MAGVPGSPSKNVVQERSELFEAVLCELAVLPLEWTGARRHSDRSYLRGWLLARCQKGRIRYELLVQPPEVRVPPPQRGPAVFSQYDDFIVVGRQVRLPVDLGRYVGRRLRHLIRRNHLDRKEIRIIPRRPEIFRKVHELLRRSRRRRILF